MNGFRCGVEPRNRRGRGCKPAGLHIKSHRDGFTIIELIVTMLLVAIIGGTSAASMMYVMQLFIYLPQDLNVRKIAQDIEDIILEGNIDIRPLRCAKAIVDASSTQITYSYGYPETIKYVRYTLQDNKIYQSTSQDGMRWSRGQVIPRDITEEVSLQDVSTQGQPALFSYYRANNTKWSSGDVKLIRRVDIHLTISSSVASLGGKGASFTVTSGTDIKQYN